MGLSQAGLLHYFDSKEDLFTEILRSRDERDRAAFGDVDADDTAGVFDGLRQVVRHNAEVPGLVQLFSQLSVEAADPQHPGHAYFVERSEALRRVMVDAVARGQREGTVSDAVPAPALARLLQAVMDGMQLQWMLEPDVDMTDALGHLLTLLAPGVEHETVPDTAQEELDGEH